MIGAVWRARRAGDERFQPRPPKPKVAQERDRSFPWAGKTRKLKPIDEHVGNSRPLPPAAEPLGPKLLVELPPDRCRFPINDPPPGRGVEMLFCAEPVAQPGENTAVAMLKSRALTLPRLAVRAALEVTMRIAASPLSLRAPSVRDRSP